MLKKSMRVVLIIAAFTVLQLFLYKTYGEIRLIRSDSTPPEFSRGVSTQASRGLPVVRLGFIGDSNMARGNPSPPLKVAEFLSKADALRVITVVNAAKGGTNAEDWRPDSKRGFFARAEANFKKERVQIVCIMLGTNPGTSDVVSPSRFEENLRAIISPIKQQGMKVVLNYPPYNYTRTATTPTALTRMRSYQNVIDTIIAERLALRGDKLAYDYFSRHPEEMADPVHLTQKGSDSLATMWAFPLARIINNIR